MFTIKNKIRTLSVVIILAMILNLAPASRARAATPTQSVTTIAGNGTPTFSGDGGPATAASLASPHGMAVAADGTVYIADSDNYRVRRIGTDGIISTIAGTGAFGDDGDGGQATSASLSGVLSIALSPAGDVLYIADIDNNRIRRVDLGSGVISNFAGVGFAGFGYAGDGGPATSAWLALPEGVAVDAAGNVYIGDVFNCAVRMVDIATNIITTVAGAPSDCTPSGDGGDAAAARFLLPRRVAVDPAGNLFVLDSGPDTVRRIDAGTNIITTIAGGGSTIPGFGDATTMNLGTPSDLALDASNNLYISNFNQVFKVDLGTGILSVFAGTGVTGFSGDGGPAQDATFQGIGGVATRGDQILIADSGNNRIRAVVPPPLPDDLIIELTTSQALLDSVNAVPGSILMVNVDGREYLLIPNATSVGLDVTLTDNDQLLIIDLNALQSVGGSITISGNLVMQSIDLSSLVTIDGSLTVTGNPALNAILISGVTTIGGDITVVGTAATVIDISALATVSGDLTVADNTAADLIDMSGLTSVGGDVTVTDNTGAEIIDISSLGTVAGDINLSGNTSATSIDISTLTTAAGDIVIVDNTAATVIDVSSVATTGGDIVVSDNTAATLIDMSSLATTGGDIVVSDNTAATVIDVSSLATTGGDLVVSDNTAATVIDVSSLATTGGDLVVSDNTASTVIDVSSLATTGGDLVIVDNGDAAVDVSSLTDVGGDLTVETTGTGTFDVGTGAVAGDLTVETTGYTDMSGTTPAGDLDLTSTHVEAVMHLQVQAASFTTPVGFTVTRVDPVALAPESGLDNGGDPATIDPVAAYQFNFEVPTLDRDAEISFDIDLAQLDAATRTDLLDALDAGTATLVTKGDGAGSSFQAFPVCGSADTPTAGGCVRIETFDALGQPTSGTPAIVRFSGVIGHFSTWAVAIVTPMPQADLSVTKSDSADPVTVGEEFRYTVIVTNIGTDAAENVILNDTLPTDVFFNFATINQGTCAIGFPTLQCQLGTINAGGSVTLNVTVTPNAGGTITNTVSVTSDTEDPDTSNNSASEETTVNPLQADLSVTTSDDADPVTEEQPVTYTVVVTNNGPDAAENVILTDTLPAGTSFNFATINQGTCAIGFPTLQCELGTVNSGGSVTLNVTVTPNAGGTITNMVSITSDTDDPDTGNNSDSEETIVTQLNTAPTVSVLSGYCFSNVLASGMVYLSLSDADENPLSLTFDSNTNPALIPNSNIMVAGKGNIRAISLMAKFMKSGTATLTFNLSDGTVTIPFTITVKVGTARNETLNGTEGADMIFGLNGKDIINGFGGNDLLCGGNGIDTIGGGDGNDFIDGQNGDDLLTGGNDNDILLGRFGNDVLTGGSGFDFFSGGAGVDTATDFNAGEGDTQDGTIP